MSITREENVPGTSQGQLSGSIEVERKKGKKSKLDFRTDSSVDIAESSFNNVPLQQAQHSDGVNENNETELKYGAAHVILLFLPVSLCMAVVILTMSTVDYYTQDDGVYLIYTPFTKKTDNSGELFAMSVGNALTMLAVVITMSLILITLYKFRFYGVIHGWLIFSSSLLLSVFTVVYLSELLNNYNITMDYFTMLFFMWNYAVVGMFCIHWKGPLLLQQFYLIMMSALMALIFIKFLPDWTVWTVLVALSVWDLVAVLCPNGPLRILVETAQERNEPIFPALIYSSGVLYLYFILTTPTNSTELLKANEDEEEEISTAPEPMASSNNASSSICYASVRKNAQDTATTNAAAVIRSDDKLRNRQSTAHRHSQSSVVTSQQNPETEERGVKLGLGDFIFYSVLVGKASSFGDWNTTVACYVAILVGLAFTLMLLALFRKALPALPISIFLGIIFYFATQNLMTPFISELSLRQYVL